MFRLRQREGQVRAVHDCGHGVVHWRGEKGLDSGRVGSRFVWRWSSGGAVDYDDGTGLDQHTLCCNDYGTGFYDLDDNVVHHPPRGYDDEHHYDNDDDPASPNHG